ncbi:MAG: DUF4241 domain-containing protein [Planctomycetota bacterium]
MGEGPDREALARALRRGERFGDLARAFRTGERFGALTIERRKVGQLAVTSNRVVVADPFGLGFGYQELERRVPRGRFPVELSVAHVRKGKRRGQQVVAAARVRFGPGDATGYRLACGPAHPSCKYLGAEFRGLRVESGTASVACASAAQGLDEACAEAFAAGELDAAATGELRQDLARPPAPQRGWGAAQVEGYGPGGATVVAFSAGWGDGVYPCYWGYDAERKLVSLVIDFLVLPTDTELCRESWGGQAWREFVYEGDRQDQFWRIRVKGRRRTIQQGLVGGDAQIHEKEFQTSDAAMQAAVRRILEQTERGYFELTRSASVLRQRKSRRARREEGDPAETRTSQRLVSVGNGAGPRARSTRRAEPESAPTKRSSTTGKARDTKARDARPRDAKARDTKARDARPRDARPRDARPRDARPRDARARDTKAREGKAREGKMREGKAREGKARDAKARDAKARDARARDTKAREGKARDTKAREGKARDAKARDAKARDAKARDARARDTKARDAKARDAKARDAKARDAKARDAKARDAKARDARARDTKAREGKARDAKKRDTKAREGKVREGKAREGKARDTKAREGKARDAKKRDTKAREGKARDTKARDAKARDAKARDAKARDAKARDAKARDGKARDTKARDGKARDAKARDAKARDAKLSASGARRTPARPKAPSARRGAAGKGRRSR